MAKILLVEDDNNLREIYEARLQAEGYEIVSAPDGEAALVVAKKELPDLVISDVMMPRISGFEMLDIMRNTEGLKHVRVIMLTALGQAEDKTRADSLGADKYLVKSQVTLEDIVKCAAELVGGDTPAPSTPSTAAAAAELAAVPVAVQTVPVAVATPPPVVPVAEPPAVAPVAVAPTPPVAAEPVALATPTPVPVIAPPEPFASTPPPAAPFAEPPVTPLPPVAVPDLATAPIPAPEPLQATPVAPVALPTPFVPAEPAAAAAEPDNQLVANAVKDLISGTASAAEPSTPTPITVQPPSTPVAPPATVEPAATETAVTPTPQVSATPEQVVTGEEAGSKRTIQPLVPGSGPIPTDLNALMAQEGHALDAVAPQDTTAHQPGQVISPNPVSPTGQLEDPSKISL